MDHPDEIISASEIGQWTYCNRAWYLARTGETNRNTHAMARGEAQHQQHSLVSRNGDTFGFRHGSSYFCRGLAGYTNHWTLVIGICFDLICKMLNFS
jgi:hypothetical protein